MAKHERICSHCGESYKTSIHNQKFCTPRCHDIDRNHKINERWAKRSPMKPRKGTVFTPLGL